MAVIDDVGVSVVMHYDDIVPLRKSNKFFIEGGRRYGAYRIVGIGDHNVFGPPGNVLRNLLQSGKKGVFLPQIIKVEFGAAQISPYFEHWVTGVGQQHHVAGIAQRHADMGDAFLRAGHGQNLVGIQFHLKTSAVIRLHGLGQFGQIPQGIMVLFRIAGSGGQGLAHMFRHREIRGAYRQIVHFAAAGQQFFFFLVQCGKYAGLEMRKPRGRFYFHILFSL